MSESVARRPASTRRIALTFFIAVACLYWSWSPQSLSGMGYAAENQDFAVSLVTRAEAVVHGRPASHLAAWPRHGVLESLLDVPFVIVTRAIAGGDPRVLDQVLASIPVLESAALCTLVLLWAQRLTRRPRLSLALACVTAFATMVWPYAYIGLETTQALAVMAAGYLVLREDRQLPLRETLGFAIASAVAVSVKSSGLYLAPAIAWLLLVSYRGLRMGRSATRANVMAFGVIAIIVLVYAGNAHTRALSTSYSLGFFTTFRLFATDSVLSYLFNAWNLLASANKGLVVFAPITLLGLVYLRQAIRARPTLGVFVALVVAGLVGGTALVFFYADETWGPRYLHAAIAPLVVVIAAAHGAARRPRWPIVALAAVGIFVSGLGATFYYGITEAVMTAARQNTLRTLQTNVAWNSIGLDVAVLRTWWTDVDRPWPPADKRWFPLTGEPFEIAPVAVSLRPYAAPQPVLLRKDLAGHIRRHVCLLFLVGGLASLVLLFLRAGPSGRRSPV